MKFTTDDILKCVNDFPTLPVIYNKLTKALSDKNAHVDQISRIVLNDPAITAKIIKFVNSPVFSLRTEVKSVSQAIFYIGFDEVKNMVLTMSVMDIFNDKSSLAAFDITDMWRHCVSVGILTKKLGEFIGEKDTENYFVAGILHDIGLLAMITAFKQPYKIVIIKSAKTKSPLVEMEEKLFGFNHYEIGKKIAEKWNLPEDLRASIEFQSSGISDDEDSKRLVACVHLANISSAMMGYAYKHDQVVPRPNPEIWEVLDLGDKDLSDLKEPFDEAYQEISGILSI